MTGNTVGHGSSAGGYGLRAIKPNMMLALGFAAGIAFWSGATCADGTTPSLEDMWKIIQQQQAEISLLKEQNARLLERVEGQAPPADSSASAEPEDTPYETAGKTDMSTPFSGTRIDLYGAAMLDMGYQFHQNDPDWLRHREKTDGWLRAA